MVLDDQLSGQPALQVLIVADDLTGACDAAVAFAAGRGSVSRVQAVSTESRDLTEREIVQRMQSIARAEGHADLIFKKIDSTLRGNVHAEITAAMDAFQCNGAIITPAFPDMGRSVQDGHLHVDGVRVRHAGTGMLDAVTNEDLDRLVAMASAITRSLLDAEAAPQFTKVERAASTGASMAGVRVTTGTIPDYATEVAGLLLGGVVGGGPAEKAGLTKGDIVIELAGKTIANIYDYTFTLELLKAGEPVKVVYMRGGVRHEVMLTPTARP